MRFSVLLVLLAIAPAAWCQAAGQDKSSALDVIERCSDSADEETIGLTALEEECPGVTQALELSGYLPMLSSEPTSVISASCVAGIRQRSRKLLER